MYIAVYNYSTKYCKYVAVYTCTQSSIVYSVWGTELIFSGVGMLFFKLRSTTAT